MVMAHYDIIIRSDACPQIGAGHIMRCLAFAQMCQTKSIKILFVVSCTILDFSRQRISTDGFDIVMLSCPMSSLEDAIQTSQLAKKFDAKYILVDGYHFTRDYLERLRNLAWQLMMIVDFDHIPDFVDVIINQNGWASSYLYPSRCKQFLGLKYLLLRREFWSYRLYQKRSENQHLLIIMGGTDLHGVTERIVNLLSDVAEALQVSVVLPFQNLKYDNLIKNATKSHHQYHWHYHLSDVPQLMEKVDLAITAGGSTCWELAFMQIPSLVIIQSENQVKVAEFINENRLGLNLGWYNEINNVIFTQKLAQLVTMKNQHKAIQTAVQTLQIGQSTFEIGEYLAESLQ